MDYSQLLEAPGIVAARLYVCRLGEQKKFNLKQMRKAMWDTLSSAVCGDDSPAVDENCLFSELYADMQPALSPSNRKALSHSLAFVALLSLANEQKLRLTPVDGVDIRISRMTSTARSVPEGSDATDFTGRVAKRSGNDDGPRWKRLRLMDD